jgi:hypothetical protein
VLCSGLQPASVVANGEHEPIVHGRQSHFDRRRLGVTNGVPECLLGDPIHDEVNLGAVLG